MKTLRNHNFIFIQFVFFVGTGLWFTGQNKNLEYSTYNSCIGRNINPSEYGTARYIVYR